MSLDILRKSFSGKLYFDTSTVHQQMLQVYATDASVYQEKPEGVAIPKDKEDIIQLIRWANENKKTLVPRAAGTSLAGQVVSSGIIVDISTHFTKIHEINMEEGWVIVEPGVIRDDLNAFLKDKGWMFGPETSTANRAMIGGMIGNNSCGLHSIIWGTTRDQLMAVEIIWANGETDWLDENTNSASIKSKWGEYVEQKLDSLLSKEENQELIEENFPKKTVTRRNTGYALDALLAQKKANKRLDLTKLIAGSEGTLGFVTKAKLRLMPLPPKEVAVVAVHCATLRESLEINLVALEHQCAASELVDDFIMSFAAQNPQQKANSDFVVGSPKALLMVEFFGDTLEELTSKYTKFIAILQENEQGFAYPVLIGDETKKAWDLRKAGLGLLRNLPGDTQPVNLIEDCAVAVEDLPDYMDELELILQRFHVQYSVYAHAGAGELHVEPMLNLKEEKGRKDFREILKQTTELVKKYKGSLSGEHGDGRLRGEFIPQMMGEKVYALFQETKQIVDPNGVFNRGKIVDTPPMDAFLRVDSLQNTNHLPQTVFDFSAQENILRLSEKCSGSGDCRKTEITGGTMCPSFMATRQEQQTTRARANMLRNFYGDQTEAHANQLKETLDTCLSCKGCKTECPSSVDITKMKAEFLQSVYDKEGAPVRAKLIARFSQMMKLASVSPKLYNYFFGNPVFRRAANRLVGFAPERTMPLLGATTVLAWWDKHAKNTAKGNSKVYLFVDEFTNYNDVSLGIKTILLIESLGYEVVILRHQESGRTYLSKGFLREAREKAAFNVELFAQKITKDTPLVGIEPSAILTFRDEYIDLLDGKQKEAARKIAENTFLFEEWFNREVKEGKITKQQFTFDKKVVKLHVHCHQKAISGLVEAKKAVSFPKNYEVQLIPSGCCGMAGSFGYEKEHYDLSMQIGELVLFPAVRNQDKCTLIAATGTSCRHQIKDGTGRSSAHSIEILYDALKNG